MSEAELNEDELNRLQLEASQRLEAVTGQAQEFVTTQGKTGTTTAYGAELDTHNLSDIEVDDKDLDAAFADAIEGDKEELDADDAEILAEFEKGDDGGGEISLDMALNEMEAEEKKTKPKAAASAASESKKASSNAPSSTMKSVTKSPTATQSQPATEKAPSVPDVPKRSEPMSTAAKRESASKPLDTPAAPASPKPEPHIPVTDEMSDEARQSLIQSRTAGYNKMIETLRGNVEDISRQMKILLVQKTDEANARASKFLGIRRHREKAIELLERAKALALPIPPFQLVKLELEKERILNDIGENEIKVVVTSCMNMKSSMKAFVQFGWSLFNRGKKISTKTVKGQNVIFNSEHSLALPAGARQNQAFLREFKRARIEFSLVSQGLLWNSDVGKGDLKVGGLLNTTELSSPVRLKDDVGDTVGELHIICKVRKPLQSADIIKEEKFMLVLDDPQGLQSAIDRATGIPTGTVTTDIGAETKDELAVTARPTEDIPAAKTTVAPKQEEKTAIPEEGDALLKHLGIDMSWEALLRCTDVSTNPSFDALTAEVENCNQQIEAARSKGKAPPRTALERKEDAERIKMVLEVAVANEKLSLEDYLSLVREAITRDEGVLKILLRLVMHWDKAGDKERAQEWKITAITLKKRLDIMKAEVKNAEENL